MLIYEQRHYTGCHRQKTPQNQEEHQRRAGLTGSLNPTENMRPEVKEPEENRRRRKPRNGEAGKLRECRHVKCFHCCSADGRNTFDRRNLQLCREEEARAEGHVTKLLFHFSFTRFLQAFRFLLLFPALQLWSRNLRFGREFSRIRRPNDRLNRGGIHVLMVHTKLLLSDQNNRQTEIRKKRSEEKRWLTVLLVTLHDSRMQEVNKEKKIHDEIQSSTEMSR